MLQCHGLKSLNDGDIKVVLLKTTIQLSKGALFVRKVGYFGHWHNEIYIDPMRS
jgi:hypothetical protein